MEIPPQDQRASQSRSPEAGDGHTIKSVPTSEHAQAFNIPQNILSGYPMQWALTRTINIINVKHSIRVSAYKLATKSNAFRELIRQTGSKTTNSAEPDQATYSHFRRLQESGSHELMECDPLLVNCDHNPKRIAELLFAVHFCHIGHCEINGIVTIGDEFPKVQDQMIERLENRCDNEEGIPLPGSSSCDEVLYQNSELKLGVYSSSCCLQFGLRVASVYGIQELNQLCQEYTQSILSPANCWLLWHLATTPQRDEKYNHQNDSLVTINPEFTNIVELYITSNFSDIMNANQSPSVNRNTEADGLHYEDMTVEQVKRILRSDYLNVNREGEVVEAVSIWLENRRKTVDGVELARCTTQLLSECVRITELKLEDIEVIYKMITWREQPKRNRKRLTIPPKLSIPTLKLKRVEKMQLKFSQTECMAHIRQARRRLFRSSRNLRPLVPRLETQMNRGNSNNAQTEEHLFLMEPRVPHEAIFTFGGWKQGNPCKDVCVFDSRKGIWNNYSDDGSNQPNSTKKRWTNQIVLPYELMSFGITMIANRLICIAGGERLNTQTTSKVICYDLWQSASGLLPEPESGWKPFPSLHESRRDLVLVNVADECIYALGGDSNRAVLSTVECLDVRQDSLNRKRGWVNVQNMLVSRGAPAADALNGIIFVCGGYTESRMEALTNSCEAYDTRTDQWTFIQPMAQARYYAHAVSVDGVLFVLGGGGESGVRGTTRVSAHSGYSSTVERYDPTIGTWELMPPTSERADFAACLFEGQLVCLGGGGEQFCTDDVEYWKPWFPRDLSEQTSYAQEQTENAGPVWLASGSTTTETTTTSWRKSKRLPFPTWGHRCVVPKGCSLILPYLDRRENKNFTINSDIEQQSMTAVCSPHNNQYILDTSASRCTPQSHDFTSERSHEKASLEM